MWKKWRLFHAIDFQSLMYPCFIFCNILGIFPYKINGTTFETSKQHYILSTIIICVFCIYELVVLYEIDVTQTVKYKGIPKTLERNCFYILGSFIAIVTHILSGPRMHLLQAIMKISWRVPFNSYRKLSRLIHAKDILGFFFLVAGGVLYYTTLDFDTWHKALVPYIHLLVFQMDMLYMNCVCVLKACFKGINNDLKNLRELLINDKPYLPRQIYHSNLFLLVELKALKKQHIVVSSIVQMLNMIFSLQLIASIILTFAEITFNLYFYIMHWKIGILMSNMSDHLYDIFLIGIMVYYSIKMVLIGWACETGKDEAVKIVQQ